MVVVVVVVVLVCFEVLCLNCFLRPLDFIISLVCDIMRYVMNVHLERSGSPL